MGNLLEGDFSQDKPNIKISIDSLVKNDKDPEMAKQMMEMVLQMTFEKTKSLQEEYKENGFFVETDIKTGKIKEGKYLFDDSKSILTKWYNNSANKVNFKIKIAKNTLTIKSDLKTKEGEAQQELTIIYNKI